MELDDLRKSWNKSQLKSSPNTNIMDIIHHKSYGPVAVLKREFRKQIIVMAILPFTLLLLNVSNLYAVFTNIMFLTYVAFCIGVIVFSYFNYRIVRKMEDMHGMVKSNLEQQIKILEERLRWNMIGLRFILICFILLTEILPWFVHYRLLDYWHSLNPIIRFSAYALLFIAQYFASRKVSQRKFGNHLTYLKELVRGME